MPKITGTIEKKILLRAPRSRVWRALTDPDDLGRWFHAKLTGTVAPGARLAGPVTHPDYEPATLEVTIERVERERLLSWRWHPFAIDAGVDYSKEPTTLVVFTLEDAPGGTLLTVVEFGFDGVPAARRGKAFLMNEQGWGMVVGSIAADMDVQ